LAQAALSSLLLAPRTLLGFQLALPAAQMMRTLVLLAGLGLAGAETAMEKKAECVELGGEAASELVDAGIFIWAAVKRCDDPKEATKCAIDISNSIESTTGMVNVIMKTLERCGHLGLETSKCGLASSELTQSLAGVTAASLEVKEKCPKDFATGFGAAVVTPPTVAGVTAHPDWHHASAAMCVVDLKESAHNLFKSISAFSMIKNDCEGEAGKRRCAANTLKIVSALAELGHYMVGALGHCTANIHIAHCGGEVAELVGTVTEFSEASIKMSEHCNAEAVARAGEAKTVAIEVPVEVGVAPRLYSEAQGTDHSTGGVLNIALAAFLPITAIVSFVGGRFFASCRRSPTEYVLPQE